MIYDIDHSVAGAWPVLCLYLWPSITHHFATHCLTSGAEFPCLGSNQATLNMAVLMGTVPFPLEFCLPCDFSFGLPDLELLGNAQCGVS